MDKSGQSILERAAAAARADTGATAPAITPAVPAGASVVERAAARAANPPPRPVSFAQTQENNANASAGATPFAYPDAPGLLAPRATPPAGSRAPRRGTIDFARLAARGYITPDAAQSLTAEEFRLIKRQLLANAAARGPGAIHNANLILVGSAMPAEGKTFCAINLALSIAAERDLTVLLVDADVSKPEIVSRLGLEGGPGLIDVVADRTLDIGDCLVRTNIPNLTVLPAGRPHGLTTELFASERMVDLIEEIARRYTDRIVVFDSPPALVTSAASVLAGLVGQVVFVVAAELTREAELKEGLAMMSGCPNVQLLLNRSRFFPGARRFAAHDYYA